MEIHLIHAENFKLDGGACFGVVPKNIWSKLCPVDEHNMVEIALRNLLVVDGKRIILFDTGIGQKQSEKFLSYYHLFGNSSLEKSFQEVGYTFDDVTDVVFTHLHFDHCGGAVKRGANNTLEPAFKNAKYWLTRSQWENALNPNPREKASYLSENYMVLHERGLINLIDEAGFLTDHVFLRIVNGHTIGQIFPIIDYNGKKIVFGADFIATSINVPLAYIPSYDIQPLLSMEEKKTFLEEAASDNFIIVFQHDFYNECATVEKTDKGNFKVKDIYRFADVL